jgi:hypothetical protein
MLSIKDIIKKAECYHYDILNLNVFVIVLELIKEINFEELKKFIDDVNRKGANNLVVLGVPKDLNFTPCELAQAYVYYLEDLLNNRVRIKNVALALLSYLLGESQVHKFIDMLSSFNTIYVISSLPILDLCNNIINSSCNIEELHRLAEHRIELMT